MYSKFKQDGFIMNIMQFVGVFISIVFWYPTHLIAAISTPIPHGQGAFFYDNGSIGQWIPNIINFNTINHGFPPKKPGGTVPYPINRFYINVGDIDVDCSANPCTVNVGYVRASTAAYYARFHSTSLIFALIGAQKGEGDNAELFSDAIVAENAAAKIVSQVCADSSVKGAVLDIEPFAVDAFSKGSAIYTLYNTTAQGLQKCKKSMGIFMNPGTVFTAKAWGNVMPTIGSNSFLIVGAYDIKDGCINPNGNTQSAPWPYAGFSIPSSSYQSSVSGKISYMTQAAKQYSIPFTVAIPAAASLSEFAEYNVQGYTPQYTPFYTCPINPPQNQPCTNVKAPTLIHQLDYVQTARGIISSTSADPSNPKPNVGPLFLGVDYWAWTEPLNPQCAFAPGHDVLLPNTPPGTAEDQVIGYLQNTSFAQQSG